MGIPNYFETKYFMAAWRYMYAIIFNFLFECNNFMLENVFQHSKRNFVSPSGPNNIYYVLLIFLINTNERPNYLT